MHGKGGFVLSLAEAPAPAQLVEEGLLFTRAFCQQAIFAMGGGVILRHIPTPLSISLHLWFSIQHIGSPV